MDNPYRIDRKIAVVTGAGGGIGKAIAIKLAQMGARVFAADIDLAAARSTVRELPMGAEDQNHEAAQIDVTDEANVKAVYAYIGRKFGQIDITINNAGVSTMGALGDLTERDWDHNMDVNAKGVFLCTKHALPYMRKRGGTIVNTSSMASILPAPLLAHYTASKYAVTGFTKVAAKELAKHGITVNCVCPGFVLTGMQDREVIWEAALRGMQPEDVRQEYIELTPLGRLCMPQDVANAVGFLVSPQAAFLTGVALPVTGGADL